MMRSRLLLTVVLCLLGTGWSLAADPPPPLLTAVGTVDKVAKDTLIIRPRAADGKFAKSIELTLTGTSKVATLAPQTRAGKLVLTQRDTEARDLQHNQAIAIIYTNGPAGPVLLTAVVQPSADK
jgi:hypothetical protein